ncbi:unnamed protein product [Bursaphelenchus okinawaensis]|uniref:Organic solute transporter alpha-like protein n=1 Tax=Bursaphelenchus okinawaensis TaxID=465554 RepID=A0A811KC10_9BILA|nr:unnamed protein product [Bursaphelenchus okinawaensis]CAG9097909.1 unnamed protein product [Bursaphelenchus okinawaensis]
MLMIKNESVFQFVLRELKSLYFPAKDYTCGNETRHEVTAPSIFDFLKNVEKHQMIMLIIGSALTLVAVIVGLFECIYVYRKVSSERRRNKLYFIITLFPISMIFCLVGMFSPRTAPLATSGGMLYFLLCLFVLVSLIRHLTQGRHQLSRELLIADRRINFQSPPFCCLLPCLPEARPTLRNLRILEFIVLQAPIVRAVVIFIEATITIEIQRDASYEIQLCELGTLVSILMAVFGVHTLFRLVADRIAHFGFTWMFRIVDVALFLFSAQHPVIFQNILLRFEWIGCTNVLTPEENARFLCNFIIICELFFLSILGFVTMAPSRNRLFDLYKSSDDQQPITENDSLTDTLDQTTSSNSVICFNNP